MSGTALATIVDMGTYEGQMSHYLAIKSRLGLPVKPRIYILPRIAPEPREPPPLERRKQPHEFWYVGESNQKTFPSSAQLIIGDVCVKYKVSKEELFGEQRSKNIVWARHEAFYRMKKETTLSLARIGARLGGRDHTTVISGVAAHIRRNGL